jgi:hypothetical protein
MTAPPDAALEKFLRPVGAPADSVTLEIFQARIPLEEDAQIDKVWQQIDEQRFDAELRRRLLANGLRAGVVGGAFPDEIAHLLDIQSESPGEAGDRVITPQSALSRVTRSVVQVNRREPKTVKASELRDEAEVFTGEDGRLRGRTFRQVEGIYSLSAEALPGQQVAVRLTPELHHGELKQRRTPSDQGIFVFANSREREAFDGLTLSADLTPGELLVVGCLPEADGSLGGVLHTAEASGRRERKFLLIRVFETPKSEILAED